MDDERTLTAFRKEKQIAAGTLAEVLAPVKAAFDLGDGEPILIFEDQSGKQVDFEMWGTLDQILARELPKAGPGRPKMGVVSREISLLPRHWEWLEQQPNGASAALRRLVDQARKDESGAHKARIAKEISGRVMTALAGDRPGYEEATRALYAGDRPRFEDMTKEWPLDVRAYIERVAGPAFQGEA